MGICDVNNANLEEAKADISKAQAASEVGKMDVLNIASGGECKLIPGEKKGRTFPEKPDAVDGQNGVDPEKATGSKLLEDPAIESKLIQICKRINNEDLSLDIGAKARSKRAKMEVAERTKRPSVLNCNESFDRKAVQLFWSVTELVPFSHSRQFENCAGPKDVPCNIVLLFSPS